MTCLRIRGTPIFNAMVVNNKRMDAINRNRIFRSFGHRYGYNFDAALNRLVNCIMTTLNYLLSIHYSDVASEKQHTINLVSEIN